MMPAVPPITFAHRGARTEEPENTLPAFRRALELGTRGLETDAHLSADGEVVLVHDGVVRAGWRRRRVATSRAAELAEHGIPRLADLYAELGADFELSIDLKGDGVGDAVLVVARGAGAVDRLWLCSPALGELHHLRERSREVHLVHSTRRDRIDVPLERHAADLADRAVDVLNLHYTEWTAGLVGLFHRFGVLAFAWDAQEVRHLRAVLAMGVDGLYCDRVDRMVATVAEWSDGR